MKATIEKLLETCITKLERGELTSESLREAFKELGSERKTKQNILVLLASSTSLHSTVQSMFMYENGVLTDGPIDRSGGMALSKNFRCHRRRLAVDPISCASCHIPGPKAKIRSL